MMKRKLFWLLLPLLILLTGCSADYKEKFIERFENLSQEKGTYDYQLTLSDLNIGKDIDVSFLENKAIKGTFSKNIKEGKLALSMKLSELDSDYSDLFFYYIKNKAYVNADALAAVTGVPLKSEQFKGKFVDLSDLIDQELPNIQDLDMRANSALFDGLSESRFKKVNDSVGVVIPYHAILDSLIAMDDWDTPTLAYFKLMKIVMSEASSIAVALWENGKGGVDLTIKAAEGYEGTSATYTLNLAYKPITYTAPKLPEKLTVLSKEEFENILEDSMTLSDEDFATVYDNLKDLSADDLTYFLGEAKAYLTEEQLKKVEDLVTDDK